MSRTKESPHFMQRVIAALDIEIAELNTKVGVSYNDVIAMWQGSRGLIAAVDQDEAWGVIAEYIDKRIGLLLSVREELQRKLSADRRERAAQRLRIENR